MRRLYLDCEFNGFGGELISMALVSNEGRRHWYQVKKIPTQVNPWVADNVIPILGKSPIGNDMFKKSLHEFLMDEQPDEIIADWPSDLMHFFNELHGNNYEETLNISLAAKLLPQAETSPREPHNALSDAFALAHWYETQSFQ
jgi:hypothetical protein